MRGYGESSKPPGIENYTLEKLAGDVAQLIRALGEQQSGLQLNCWIVIVQDSYILAVNFKYFFFCDVTLRTSTASTINVSEYTCTLTTTSENNKFQPTVQCSALSFTRGSGTVFK